MNTSEIMLHQSARARTLERRVALASVFVPALGTLVTFGFGVRFGFHPHALIVALVLYLLTMLGVTVGFHRLATHRAFKTVRPVRDVLLILGSMAVQGPPIYWVAAHRKHHESSDRPGDPHSPHASDEQLLTDPRRSAGAPLSGSGFLHAHVGWMFEYAGADLARYTRDLLRDRSLLELNQRYPIWVLLGLFTPAAIDFAFEPTLLSATGGFLLGGLTRIFAVHHATWAVNSVCHTLGARPFRTNDRSSNSSLVALLTLGEGWHNNHHAFPTSARHGLYWWQLDMSYAAIKLLATLGLASEVRVPSERDIQRRALRAAREELSS